LMALMSSLRSVVFHIARNDVVGEINKLCPCEAHAGGVECWEPWQSRSMQSVHAWATRLPRRCAPRNDMVGVTLVRTCPQKGGREDGHLFAKPTPAFAHKSGAPPPERGTLAANIRYDMVVYMRGEL
jgi:hypothetical protein